MARRTNLTQTDAATRLEISTSWLRVLSDRGELTRNKDGSYPWPKLRKEYDAYRKRVGEQQNDADGNGLGGIADARVRKILADAELREDALRRKRAELVPIGDMLNLVRPPLEAVDLQLRTAPRRHGKEVARKLKISQARAIRLIADIVEPIRADLRRVFENGHSND